MTISKWVYFIVTLVVPVLWIAALFMYARVFKALYKAIDNMNDQLAVMGCILIDLRKDSLATASCLSCGAVLKGRATIHKEGCQIQKIIEQEFPPSPMH